MMVGWWQAKCLQTWIESDEREASGLKSGIKKADNTLSTTTNLFPASPNHKVKMKFKAIQGIGRVQYRGWVTANFDYYAYEGTSNFEITEKVANKELFINRSENYLGYTSLMGLRWGF
jgi:hypothetical protein